MRRIISVLALAAVTFVVTGSAALAQTNTPTSFSGGPDVSSDVTTRGPADQRPEGNVVAGTADEAGDDSSAAGWVIGLVVAAVVIGGIVFLVRRGTRDDTTVRA